ncbi:sulfotransferase [Tropicimonas marinistellae]|uniref:sulfotransferase n=1 Tax=Tropicimonas marinistellae TaxID=1739787 RepID=UPI00082A0748|nr:sulfotransferase [Tropicimonas marinistellae]
MRPSSATTTLFETEDSRTAPHRTFHIFGNNRGGTTAVTGLAMRLGLDFGDEAEMEGNLEDKAFRMTRGIEAIAETVEARNAAQDTWGWKHPHSLVYLPKILPRLRNPRLILVTRDPVANAMSIEARDKVAFPDALAQVLRRTRKNTAFVRRTAVPTLLVSYEKLLLDPAQVSTEMGQFCNVDVTERKLAELVGFVRPGSYQPPQGRATFRYKLAQTRALWRNPR